MDQKASAKVLVLDFGAQYGQLIARRVRDLNVYSEIVPCDISADEIREMNASALILSGGPASVYAEDAPSIDPAIFDLGLPVLGFCYGHQITAVTLGGKVGHSEVGEYGRATITRTAGAKLFNSTPMEQTVWMSHRDAVSEVPEGFTVTASTDTCPVAAMEDASRNLYATQFHPELTTDDIVERVRAYRYEGYFAPHELEATEQTIRSAPPVTWPSRLLRAFAERYAR